MRAPSRPRQDDIALALIGRRYGRRLNLKHEAKWSSECITHEPHPEPTAGRGRREGRVGVRPAPRVVRHGPFGPGSP